MRLGRLLLTGAVLMAGSVAMAALTNAGFETDNVGDLMADQGPNNGGVNDVGITGWSIYSGEAAIVDITGDTRPGGAGTKALEITNYTAYPCSVYQSETAVADGQEWEVAAWVRVIAAPGGAQTDFGRLGWFQDESPFAPAPNIKEIADTVTTWTQFSATDVLNDGQAGFADAQVQVRQENGVMQVDDFTTAQAAANVGDWSVF